MGPVQNISLNQSFEKRRIGFGNIMFHYQSKNLLYITFLILQEVINENFYKSTDFEILVRRAG